MRIMSSCEFIPAMLGFRESYKQIHCPEEHKPAEHKPGWGRTNLRVHAPFEGPGFEASYGGEEYVFGGGAVALLHFHLAEVRPVVLGPARLAHG